MKQETKQWWPVKHYEGECVHCCHWLPQSQFTSQYQCWGVAGGPWDPAPPSDTDRKSRLETKVYGESLSWRRASQDAWVWAEFDLLTAVKDVLVFFSESSDTTIQFSSFSFMAEITNVSTAFISYPWNDISTAFIAYSSTDISADPITRTSVYNV